MGMLVLAIVSVVAFAAMRLSMNIIFRVLDSVNSEDSRKTIRYAMLIITPVLWFIIYFFPVEYGGPPKVFNLWLMIWSVKTICYFMAPALVAVLVSMYLKSKKN